MKFVSFDTTLNNSASVKVYLYLMDEYGVIKNGDEAIAVMPGRCTCMTRFNSATKGCLYYTCRKLIVVVHTFNHKLRKGFCVAVFFCFVLCVLLKFSIILIGLRELVDLLGIDPMT